MDFHQCMYTQGVPEKVLADILPVTLLTTFKGVEYFGPSRPSRPLGPLYNMAVLGHFNQNNPKWLEVVQNGPGGLEAPLLAQRATIIVP